MIIRKIKNLLKYLRIKVISFNKKIILGDKCLVGWTSTFEGSNKISERSIFGESHIGFGSYVGADCKILNTSIGRYTSIADEVKTVIGTHPSIKFVSTHPSFYSLQKQAGFTYVKEQLFDELSYLDHEKKISIIIGNDVWIGANVIIMSGSRIGDGAIIATGAIVANDVEPYCIYGGVPAKKIRSRFNDREIEYLLNLRWWDKGEMWIKENFYLFNDINNLMKVLG